MSARFSAVVIACNEEPRARLVAGSALPDPLAMLWAALTGHGLGRLWARRSVR